MATHTYRLARAGFNKINGLANHSRMVGGPLLSRCDNTPGSEDRARLDRESGAASALDAIQMARAAGARPAIPGSDSKLAADLLVVEHMRLLGVSPALRTAGSITRSRSTELAPRSSGSGRAQRHRGAHDLADRDASALARQL